MKIDENVEIRGLPRISKQDSNVALTREWVIQRLWEDTLFQWHGLHGVEFIGEVTTNGMEDMIWS
jgi:hypothetical protein